MRIYFSFLLCSICYLVSAQSPSYDDLYFESDSLTKTYSPNGKNYAFIRSKRGSEGVNQTPTADSIRKFPITDIVLVFTEQNASAISNRETANRERWENLIKTYPEFFQDNTNLLNMCQCSSSGDGEAFKLTQGFYIYYEAKNSVALKKTEEKKPEEPKKVEKEKPEKIKEEKIDKSTKEEKVVKTKPIKEEKPKREEKPLKEEQIKEVENPVSEPVVVAPKVKKEGYAKPKKAKDPKACRAPCYEGGDEDLFAFFKEYLPLSKKQRRKSGDLVCVLRIQLNFDGTIKKTFVQGANQEFNKLVEEAVKQMNNWNGAVKGGVTIKSEVKMTLKYDNSTKAIKPFDFNIIPRPGPKCPCVPDSQLFED